MANDDREKVKPPIMARFSGPGPGNYQLPPTVGYEKHDFTRLRNPAYSMGARTGMKSKAIVPGPKYDLGNYTRYGKSGVPAYSLAPKLAPLTPFKGPGPGTYAPEKCPQMKDNRPPAYTLGSRTKTRKLDQVPAPNAYTMPTYLGPKIPNKEAAAAYSMGGKAVPLKGFQSPGPATYDPGSTNLYKTKQPQYSLVGRTPGVGNKSPNPGPAGYLPMYNVNKNEPKFSFGVRHTEYSVPCITDEDNM